MTLAWQIKDEPLQHPVVQLLCGDKCNAPAADPLLGLAQIGLRNMRLVEHGGRLVLRGFIGNNAEYAQPQPVIVIRLLDVHGELISRRSVNPPNYLKRIVRLPMAPGQTREVKYTLDDPGGAAIKYSLSLKTL